MKTRSPRSSFHHAVVTSFGARRSISRANASAQRRTSRKPHFGSIRQATWMPRLPDVFGQPTKPSSSSVSLHDCRDLLRLGEAGARLGVDVDAELVRVLDVAPPRRPGMEVDRREIGGPRDLRELGDAELVGGAARGEGDGRGLDPVGPVLRHALLVDRLALGAVRVPLQLRRPLVEHPHDALADGEVVLDEVELRLAARAEEDLVRIRHLDGALPDLELDERRFGH